MAVLLDTQALIWYVEDNSLLTLNALNAIRDAAIVYVSPISFYEIAIKLKIGKDAGIKRPLTDVIKTILRAGFIWLPLSAHHIETYLLIPLFEQHRDPFDRMLLATALADKLTVVSSDHNFALYSDLVETIW